MSINSYPSVYAIGHSAIKDLFLGPVIIEEKIDGSQFSFGVIDGELQCRSKGKQLILDAPEKMFEKAVGIVKETAPALKPGWTRRHPERMRSRHQAGFIQLRMAEDQARRNRWTARMVQRRAGKSSF